MSAASHKHQPSTAAPTAPNTPFRLPLLADHAMSRGTARGVALAAAIRIDGLGRRFQHGGRGEYADLTRDWDKHPVGVRLFDAVGFTRLVVQAVADQRLGDHGPEIADLAGYHPNGPSAGIWRGLITEWGLAEQPLTDARAGDLVLHQGADGAAFVGLLWTGRPGQAHAGFYASWRDKAFGHLVYQPGAYDPVAAYAWEPFAC